MVWFKLLNPCIRNPIIMLRRPSTSRDISHGELFFGSPLKQLEHSSSRKVGKEQFDCRHRTSLPSSPPPHSTVEKPGASSGGKPPQQAPRSKREKTVLLTAAARRRFARAPLPAKTHVCQNAPWRFGGLPHRKSRRRNSRGMSGHTDGQPRKRQVSCHEVGGVFS